MITRDINEHAKRISINFRSIAIMGPRQSGKSTLAKQLFPLKEYVSLEDPDEYEMATNDPKHFLERFKKGAIIDEAQKVPHLFNYLLGILDKTKVDALFVLTGSNNFLLQESITQSLAGRIGFIDLLPLSFQEILKFKHTPNSPESWMYNGSYPELYDKHRAVDLWYASYIRSYIERDVKQLRNIESMSKFITFLKVCAAHVGNLINLNSISSDIGIDVRTLNAWMSILESNYIIFKLEPYHNSFKKRILKTPKLYFYDTGLVCALLNIQNEEVIYTHASRGALFENQIVSELKKQQINFNTRNSLYFWRDSKGLEIDVLIETNNKLVPIEIKAAKTLREDFFSNINKWNEISGNTGGYLIYGGALDYKRKDDILITPWNKFPYIIF